jgi:hypothetical protein
LLPESRVTRLVYVVARDRPDLYAALRETFIESSRLAIILDRRGAEPAADAPAERRHLVVEEVLRTRGWARVRIDADGGSTIA